MLRDLSDALSRYLLQVFPPDHGYTRAEFSRDPMPPLVSTFLVQMLQSRVDLEADRLRDLRSEWFDFDHPDVQHAQTNLITTLGQHVRIPKEEWPRLLKEAVTLVVSYLVRPVPTLLDFIFDEEDEGPIPVADIFQGFSFFGAYPYLREVSNAYFQQKHVREIERPRFETILRHSDRQMTQDYSASSWMRLLAPLYATLGTDPSNTERTVPVEVLDAFFAEKDAGQIRIKLREASEHDPHARISEADLRRLLESPLHQPAPAAVQEAESVRPYIAPPQPVVEEEAPETDVRERAPEPVAPVTEPQPAARTAEPQPAPRASEPQPAPQKAVPLWQQFQKDKPAAPIHESARVAPAREAPRPAPPPPAPVSRPQPRPSAPPPQEQGARNVPLWMRFRKQEQPPPNQSAASNMRALELAVLGETGSRNRDVFVQQLFAGSEADYERILRELNAAGSWRRASRIIADEVFRKNQVNIYSEPAVAFTNAIEEQYRQ